MRTLRWIAVASTVLALSGALRAEDESSWRSRGEISFEARVFEDDSDSGTKDGGAGIAARIDARYDGETVNGRVRVLGRTDQIDTARSQAVAEEAWIGWESGDIQLRLGAQMLTWTATEAFHPADIINSRNLDSNIENAEKIGEPMALLTYRPGSAIFQAMVMPAYMRPFLPSSTSRLSLVPSGLEIGNPLWLERDGDFTESFFGLQWGLRAAYSFEGADLSVHLVQHQDRSQPLVVFDSGSGEFRPLFLPVTQVGGTYQQAIGGLLVKVEAAYRMFELPSGTTQFGAIERDNHAITAMGLEYGWSHESGAQSTLIAEAQAVLGAEDTQRASLSPFQRDVLAGYRFAWNDELSREAMLSVIWDVENAKEFLLNLSYGQRLSDTWSLKGGFRKIHAPQTGATPTGLQTLDGANQVYLNLTRSF